MPNSSSYVCDLAFTFECDQPNCCESYHTRFIMLIVACATIALAVVVGVAWFLYTFRSQPQQPVSAEPDTDSVESLETTRIRQQNMEEARHLRRMSELRGLHPTCKA